MMYRSRFTSGPVAIAVIVTVVTLLVAGGIILTTTSLGCGPLKALGMKGGALAHCTTPVASVTSPSPHTSQFPSPLQSPSFPPLESPASATPTVLPSAEPTVPTEGPASAAYPPFDPPTSGPNNNIVPTFNVNCRLPVYVGPPGSGGFVVFPGNSYVSDPASAVTPPSPTPAPPTPTPQMGGPGYAGLAFDRQFSKWVPAPPTQVSPDGAHYVFVLSGHLYVHDMAGGTTTELGVGHAWNVVGVSNTSAYATIPSQAGLWWLDYGGASTQLTNVGFWQAASPVAAYGTAESALPQGIANTIIRLDMKGGQVANYFSRGGAQTYVVGVDARGDAILQVNYYTNNGPTEVWDGNAPLFSSGTGLSLQGAPFADSHGVWFSMGLYIFDYGASYSASGIVLYVPGGHLYWMSSYGGIQLSGGCF